MSNPSPEVVITRAERLRLSRFLNGFRRARLRSFRTRISDWAEPSPTVYDEPVIVTVKYRRTRLVAGEEVEWWEEYTKDHLHVDVQRFCDLIDRKKAAGFHVSIADGVVAYLTVFGFARKSIVAGFLWAMSDLYPEFREVREEIKVKETYVTPLGEVKERLVTKRVEKTAEKAEDLVSSVGEILSRLSKERVAVPVKLPPPPPPKPPITKG